ncbi:hypothetical protein RDWZM_009809 [Blomia tropicalis]|uniref:Uncharacterized protein n=1 Tax=Blomia tropicalis TaxID=40697 RepID=A0A9Q0M5Z7_BLOTA|nr:hypothetical protein RDWZM_009809 [Blomia tropicalis]
MITVYKLKWTPEEDTNLIELIKIHGLKWAKIARFMNNRNRKQCASRWNNTLDPNILKGSWTPEEDEKLRKLMEKDGSKWSLIAQYMGNRTDSQCKKHWEHLLNKNEWTQEEEKKLSELVNEYGNNWKKITENMTNHSYSDCFKKYHMHLNSNIRKGKWTQNEDKILKDLVEKFGKKWCKIADCMKNRNYHQCQQRWNTLNSTNKPWTLKEDQKLKKLVELHGLNWKEISKIMDNRKPYQCRIRWFEYLDPKIIKGEWSPEENKQLINLCAKRWRKIEKFKHKSFVEFSHNFSVDESSQQNIEIDSDSDATIIDYEIDYDSDATIIDLSN